ncbi:biotin synthase BioB [candidate division NPL-UPA2 bacterium]|nr:biotin synthase BioB [candidate division NPL-UPA2 bacterium]
MAYLPMNIQEISEKVLEGDNIGQDEALQLWSVDDQELFSLLDMANRIRGRFKGDEVDLCAIVNAKSGNCPEDCIFCSQSIHHETNIEKFPLISTEEMLRAAKDARQIRAGRFGVITSGRRISEREVSIICEGLSLIREQVSIHRCASLGALTHKTARLLKEAGLERYHHNLESSESFFPNICTTHHFQERLETVRLAKEAGLEVCSGGIFGLGETPAQRIELALTLRKLEVDSVPLNFLYPIPGTPCEEMLPPAPLEILKTVAMFRFILPTVEIKVCGGRERNLRSLQPMLFLAGASGILIGNYLTTRGQSPEADLQMIRDLGLRIKAK